MYLPVSVKPWPGANTVGGQYTGTFTITVYSLWHADWHTVGARDTSIIFFAGKGKGVVLVEVTTVCPPGSLAVQVFSK